MSGVELKFTRRDKRADARSATKVALRLTSKGLVRVHGTWSSLHETVLETIQYYGLSALPLDEWDVGFAINELCDDGVVRVAHYGPRFDRTHVVTLIQG